MKNNKEKTIYSTPEITRIKLDNEISLVLASGDTPPEPQDEANYKAPDYFNNDPFSEGLV